jgi:hypothetical protein
MRILMIKNEEKYNLRKFLLSKLNYCIGLIFNSIKKIIDFPYPPFTSQKFSKDFLLSLAPVEVESSENPVGGFSPNSGL